MAIAVAPTSASLPPHNLEAEEAVLGAIFLSERTLYALVIDDGLKAEDFYRESHRVIYGAMLELYNQSEPIDTLTVTEHLQQQGKLDDIGGPAAVDALAGPVPSVGGLRRHAAIVKEHALMRRLLRTAYEIQSSVHDRADTAENLVERAERAILEVAHDEQRGGLRIVSDMLVDELEKLQKLSTERTALTGTPSGFKDLDELTGGFQPGNLIILAARPAMGKSALMTNIAENASIDHGKTVALFSLEMSETELAQRFIASQGRIKGDDLRKGRVRERDWKQVAAASNRLGQAPLYVDDSADLGITELRGKARRLHQRLQGDDGGLDLIVVDYLQLMRADARVESRVEQVGQMSRGLKLLARELKVPVIALSQLSRAVESRGRQSGEHRPQLSDLRDSGQIEQDADLVIFIYRQEYYDRQAGKESERPGEADLIIAKHRNGAVGEVGLVFQSDYPRFMNKAAGKFEDREQQ